MFSLIPWRNVRNNPIARREDSPFRLMDREFQNLFDRILGEWPLSLSENQSWGVQVDENEKDFIVRADLPGFEKDELDVNLTENILTIEGKTKEEETKEGNGYRQVRHVRRSFTLPGGVDVEKIEANYRSGVLELHLPRLPEATGKKIEVKA